MSSFVVRWLLAGGIMLVSALALAQGPGAKLCPAPCPPAGGWELSLGVGLGISTNPLIGGSDIPLLVRPKLSYYGERFFLDNLEAGVTLWETPTQQINLLALPSLEQLYFRRWHYAAPMASLTSENIAASPDYKEQDQVAPGAPALHHRHTSALGGLEYNYTLEKFEFNIQALGELTDYHSGQELRLAISRDFLKYWRVSLGANYQSQNYVNYYFGVYNTEATQSLPSYSVQRGGWSRLARVEYVKPLSEHLAIKAGSALKIFSSAHSSSPLMEESQVHSIYIGGVYYF